MGLLTGEPNPFTLPFHPPLPLLAVSTSPNQLVSVVDSSAARYTLSSAWGRSPSLFPVSFLGLPLLCGVYSSGGVVPNIPLSGILPSTPNAARGIGAFPEQIPIPPVEASKTLGANKKEFQVRWVSDLTFWLPHKPHPLLGEDSIMRRCGGLDSYR
jgi:hypothetical protein